MTAFEQWLIESVRLVMRNIREKDRERAIISKAMAAAPLQPQQVEAAIDKVAQEVDEDWNSLELRAAVMLVQARAKEARQIETSMNIETLAMVTKILGLRDPGDIAFAKDVLRCVAGACRNRSRDLEQVALALGQPGAWPPKEEPEPAPAMPTTNGGLIQ